MTSPVIAFCLDDKPAYLMLLKAAVRSLRSLYEKDPHNIPHVVCIYAGDDKAVFAGLSEENIPLIRYQPVIRPEELPKSCQHAVGCFLKLELALVSELSFCETILYCDTDILFRKKPDELLNLRPKYLAMAKEDTLPFTHEHESLSYVWRGKDYTITAPFPIWTYNSGVVLFNLKRLRQHDYIHNFLAFCVQNVDKIGNLDQSLLNYFFGKRITRLSNHWNSPPCRRNCLEEACIVHFQGPKPWDIKRKVFADLRINDYEKSRILWKSWLKPDELEIVNEWEKNN